jgi:hypothetical protein
MLPERVWLPWRAAQRPRDGASGNKLDKIPWRATTDNPASWRTFDAVLEELVAHDEVAGIGFAIPAGIIALDFDDCRDPVTGELDPEVQRELERFNSYAYLTPSHHGFRIVGLNSRAHPIRGQKKHVRLPGGKRVEIFVGPTNHYVTFTADILPGYGRLREIADETLDLLAGLPGENEPDFAPHPSGSAEVSLRKLKETLAALPNPDVDWDTWNVVGMAVWRCTRGSQDGLALWSDWSARSRKHSETETQARWWHYFRSPPGRVGFGKLVWLVRTLPGGNPDFAPTLGLFREHSARGEAESEDTDPNDGPGERPGGRPDELRNHSIKELHELTEPEWLIEGVIPAGAFIVPFGAPKSFKTFLLLSACLHIAAGKDWMGLKVKRGAVVYVAAEGIGGLKPRIQGMCAYYGIGDDVPFWVIPRPVSLADQKMLAKLVRTAQRRADEADTPIVLVVFDTLARCAAGLDENSAQEMGAAIAGNDWVREQLKCATATIHHSGKDEQRGLRGTSALRGALDTALLIEGEGKRATLRVEDQKDAEARPELHFEMREVPACGLSGTTLVPVLASDQRPGGAKERQPQLTPNAIVCMDALVDAILEHPYPLPAGYPPGVTGTTTKHWREAFRARRAEEASSDTITKAFSRASEWLQGKRLVAVREGFAWRVKDEI